MLPFRYEDELSPSASLFYGRRPRQCIDLTRNFGNLVGFRDATLSLKVAEFGPNMDMRKLFFVHFRGLCASFFIFDAKIACLLLIRVVSFEPRIILPTLWKNLECALLKIPDTGVDFVNFRFFETL